MRKKKKRKPEARNWVQFAGDPDNVRYMTPSSDLYKLFTPTGEETIAARDFMTGMAVEHDGLQGIEGAVAKVLSLLKRKKAYRGFFNDIYLDPVSGEPVSWFYVRLLQSFGNEAGVFTGGLTRDTAETWLRKGNTLTEGQRGQLCRKVTEYMNAEENVITEDAVRLWLTGQTTMPKKKSLTRLTAHKDTSGKPDEIAEMTRLFMETGADTRRAYLEVMDFPRQVRKRLKSHLQRKQHVFSEGRARGQRREVFDKQELIGGVIDGLGEVLLQEVIPAERTIVATGVVPKQDRSSYPRLNNRVTTTSSLHQAVEDRFLLKALVREAIHQYTRHLVYNSGDVPAMDVYYGNVLDAILLSKMPYTDPILQKYQEEQRIVMANRDEGTNAVTQSLLARSEKEEAFAEEVYRAISLGTIDEFLSLNEGDVEHHTVRNALESFANIHLPKSFWEYELVWIEANTAEVLDFAKSERRSDKLEAYLQKQYSIETSRIGRLLDDWKLTQIDTDFLLDHTMSLQDVGAYDFHRRKIALAHDARILEKEEVCRTLERYDVGDLIKVASGLNFSKLPQLQQEAMDTLHTEIFTDGETREEYFFDGIHPMFSKGLPVRWVASVQKAVHSRTHQPVVEIVVPSSDPARPGVRKYVTDVQFDQVFGAFAYRPPRTQEELDAFLS